MKEPMELTRKLDRIRRRQGMSDEEFAATFPVARTTWNGYKNGVRPSVAFALKARHRYGEEAGVKEAADRFIARRITGKSSK